MPKAVRFLLPSSFPSRFLCASAFLAAISVAGPSAHAQDGDKFEGAVWTFVMTPKGRGPGPLNAAFRVSGNVLYQRSKPRGDFDKVIGKNHPRGKKQTRIEIDDLRAHDRNRGVHAGLKGTALLTADRRGEWSGRFLDSEGRHWDFKCSRTQE
jgi:hypothetical protein